MPVGTRVIGAPSIMLVRNVYSSTNVTTSAYVPLVIGGFNVGGSSTTYATTPANTCRMQIFDSSGSTLVLATGASGSQTDQFFIAPGGLTMTVDILIPKGSLLWLKAVDQDATVGEFIMTCLGGPT